MIGMKTDAQWFPALQFISIVAAKNGESEGFVSSRKTCTIDFFRKQIVAKGFRDSLPSSHTITSGM